jgi:Tol biopolymer transport system component
VTDPSADDPHPRDDGIHRIDLASGRSELIVSLDALARIGDVPRNAFQWINHVQVSPDGSRLAYFHIARTGETGWRARLFACGAEGADPSCLLDAEVVSHYDWLDNGRILIWAKDAGLAGHFFLIDVARKDRSVVGAGVLAEDGHVSFSPDRKWVLNDTYPDRHDMRTLMLFRWPDARRIDLARLHSPKSRWWGEIRCDLHPRWSRDGKQVCIDSVHTGERQMYVLDVGDIAA